MNIIFSFLEGWKNEWHNGYGWGWNSGGGRKTWDDEEERINMAENWALEKMQK